MITMNPGLGWHWLAGVLEGKGSFRFTSTPEIVIETTNADLCHRIALLFGGSVKESRKGSRVRWSAYASAAEEIMAGIYPYMTKSRQEAIKKVVAADCRVV